MFKIEGKDIYLRYVEIDDAEFLYSLRTDPVLSKYISSVNSGVAEQVDWIKKYKEREKNNLEHYFIVCFKTGERVGTIRIYDFKGNSFCSGSWIVKPDAPICIAVEAIMAMYEYGFYYLGFTQSHLDVMKNNRSVANFMLSFGAKFTSENGNKNYYVLKKEDFEKSKVKYKRFYQKIKIIDLKR